MTPIQLLHEAGDIVPLLSQIIKLADQHKESLGFLPPSAFTDAALQSRIIAAADESSDGRRVIGYVLFGGVFPHARVYQVAVSSADRRTGIASRILLALINRLQNQAYLTLSARVAADLDDALTFYQSNGFVVTRTIEGGLSRLRRISILVRSLATDDLFTIADGEANTDDLLSLALRSSQTGDAPFYAIDLNVLFDLIRNRKRTSAARQLFGAALSHRLRLVVSPEFLVELRRTTFDAADDVVLQMAMQLPTLVAPPKDTLATVSSLVHRIVFEDRLSPYAGTAQSVSDSRHVAHAAIAKASGYITSDGAVLSAKLELRRHAGIDVASLDDLVELVGDEPKRSVSLHKRGQDFELIALSHEDLHEYVENAPRVRDALPRYGIVGPTREARRLGIRQGTRLIAIGVLATPGTPGGAATLVLHPNPRWLDGARFIDALFDQLVGEATRTAPALVELILVEDESRSTIISFARARGFIRSANGQNFWKVAVGRPITAASWAHVAENIKRRSGLQLAPLKPGSESATVELGGRQSIELRLDRLEDLLSPTIVAWPNRNAVVQPIRREFADDLLGTSLQYSLLEGREASFMSRRSYVSSPRASSQMLPGSIMFFYESQRSGGRGAVVAVARIIDTLSVSKHSVSRTQMQNVVVDDVRNLTRSDDVLLTSFDNLLPLPKPCYLTTLRRYNAAGSKNLQTTTPIGTEAAAAILDYGWN